MRKGRGCRESDGLNFSFDIILDSLPLLARAAVGTVIFASAAFAIGLPLGLLVCTGSLSSSRLPRFLSRMFVSFYRACLSASIAACLCWFCC